MDPVSSSYLQSLSHSDVGSVTGVAALGVSAVISLTFLTFIRDYFYPPPPPPDEPHPPHLGFCSQVMHAENETIILTTIHCDDLSSSGKFSTEEEDETSDLRPESYSYCSKIYPGTNTNVTYHGFSVPCDSLIEPAPPYNDFENDLILQPILDLYCTSFLNVTPTIFNLFTTLCTNLPKLKVTTAALRNIDLARDVDSFFKRYYCSVEQHQMRNQVVISATLCNRLQNDISLKLSNCWLGVEYEKRQDDHERDIVTLIHYLSISLLMLVVLLALTFTFRSEKFAEPGGIAPAPTRDWAQIQEETKRKLDAVLRERQDMEEKQQKRREELESERESRAQGMIAALLGSITQSVIEERRNFNRWIETPD